MVEQSDQHWMALALKLAACGVYSTHPNPNVGCVIVKNGELVGSGFHLRAGEPHAEVFALEEAGERTVGATLYVTLEPCAHHGRTPPCVEAVIAAKPARVVVAVEDPNPLTAGKGIAAMREAGIDVVLGVLQAQAEQLNRGFFSRIQKRRPFITLKLACSLDGRTALSNGASQWITGSEARADVHRMRAQASAILTGAGTVEADNPSLNVRTQENGLAIEAPVRQPTRIVLDSSGRLSADKNVFTDGSAQTWWVTGPLNSELDSINSMTMVEHIVCPIAEKRIELTALMRELAQRDVNDLWVEAGPTLSGALWQSGLVDELVVYQAPKLLGDKGRPLLNLPEWQTMDDVSDLHLIESRNIGNDIRMTFRGSSCLPA